MAVRSQLQPLSFSPVLDGGQPLAEGRPPVVGPQAQGAGLHTQQPVEEPGADEVEQLREELNGEGGVDPAATQQRHGGRQSVHHSFWKDGGGG